jgi:TRAP-type C4-dicarboxylate transport system substrate-binding protein
MNPATYEKLNDEQKAVIDSAAEEFTSSSDELAKENFDKIYKALEDNGNVIYTLTAEENAVFLDGVKPLLDKALEVCGDDGKKLNDVLSELR